MSKRCESIYRAGKTTDWLKIKTAVGKEREAKRFAKESETNKPYVESVSRYFSPRQSTLKRP
jgi:hypothetical protein